MRPADVIGAAIKIAPSKFFGVLRLAQHRRQRLTCGDIIRYIRCCVSFDIGHRSPKPRRALFLGCPAQNARFRLETISVRKVTSPNGLACSFRAPPIATRTCTGARQIMSIQMSGDTVDIEHSLLGRATPTRGGAVDAEWVRVGAAARETGNLHQLPALCPTPAAQDGVIGGEGVAGSSLLASTSCLSSSR
jgi:hypothetical protein